MEETSIRDAVRAYALSLPDTHQQTCWGEEAFFHRPPESRRKLGHLFLTMRGDAFSIPLPRDVYVAWFGPPPARPRRRQRHASGRRHGPFAPHPLYAWNAWARVEAPTADDLPRLAWAVREAYGRAVSQEAREA